MAVILGDVLNHGPRNALPEGYGQPKSLNGLMKWHIRLSLCAQLRQRSGSNAAAFPDNRAVAQVLLEKQRLFLTHGHLFGPEIYLL